MLHLIHPALVHFSVALLLLGGASEAWGLWFRRERLAELGGVAVLWGTISLVPTLVSGYLAANTASYDASADSVLAAHERNAWFVLGIFVAALFWKGWNQGRLPATQARLFALLLVAGVLLAAYSALLGGELVYLHGVGIRR